MIQKIFSMNRALQVIPTQQGQSRLLALGDLNTMGRSRNDTLPTITAREEIGSLITDAGAAGMRVLLKSHDKTWSNKGDNKKGNLDHMVASTDLLFQEFVFTDSDERFEVEVDGWINLTGSARSAYLETISDHCALYVEVI